MVDSTQWIFLVQLDKLPTTQGTFHLDQALRLRPPPRTWQEVRPRLSTRGVHGRPADSFESPRGGPLAERARSNGGWKSFWKARQLSEKPIRPNFRHFGRAWPKTRTFGSRKRKALRQKPTWPASIVGGRVPPQRKRDRNHRKAQQYSKQSHQQTQEERGKILKKTKQAPEYLLVKKTQLAWKTPQVS